MVADLSIIGDPRGQVNRGKILQTVENTGFASNVRRARGKIRGLGPVPRSSPPLVLVVLDGWGLGAAAGDNAIAQARTPTYSALLDRYPHASLVTSGGAVGLPHGQMGNSEVGHMNLGAGRIVYQDLTRIDRSISDGSFFENAALAASMDRCAGGRHALHLAGLVSDGGVHSHQRHLHALVEMARQREVERLFVHVVTDGRDTPPTGGAAYVAGLERALADAGIGCVATVTGRYHAMDRDRRWQRTARAHDALTRGRGRTARTAGGTARRSVRGRHDRRVHRAGSGGRRRRAAGGPDRGR